MTKHDVGHDSREDGGDSGRILLEDGVGELEEEGREDALGNVKGWGSGRIPLGNLKMCVGGRMPWVMSKGGEVVGGSGHCENVCVGVGCPGHCERVGKWYEGLKVWGWVGARELDVQTELDVLCVFPLALQGTPHHP